MSCRPYATSSDPPSSDSGARNGAEVNLGLAGRGCVVTGASRGIGLATARMLCAEGARVLISARHADALRAAAEQCGRAGAEAGGEVQAVALDVTRQESAEQLVDRCERSFGRIDLLVNNAGTTRRRSLAELTEDDWREQWELHVRASERLMRAAAPRMAERGYGRIVNVCSSAGKRPSLTNPAYSVTKAAQLSLSRVYADRYAADGVLVNAVAPGAVTSPLWTAPGGLADQAAAARGISHDEALQAQAAKIPLGRLAAPEEVAAVIV